MSEHAFTPEARRLAKAALQRPQVWLVGVGVPARRRTPPAAGDAAHTAHTLMKAAHRRPVVTPITLIVRRSYAR